MKALKWVNGKLVRIEVEDLTPEPYDWHVSERPIRLVLTDEVKTRLLTLRQEHEFLGNYPEIAALLDYVKSLTVPTVDDGINLYIYLEEVYPEHEYILNKYGATVERR